MCSVDNKVIYTGVTSNLIRRVAEHWEGKPGTITGKYKVNKLVYFECGGDIIAALNREKQIKANSRAYKEDLSGLSIQSGKTSPKIGSNGIPFRYFRVQRQTATTPGSW